MSASKKVRVRFRMTSEYALEADLDQLDYVGDPDDIDELADYLETWEGQILLNDLRDRGDWVDDDETSITVDDIEDVDGGESA